MSFMQHNCGIACTWSIFSQDVKNYKNHHHTTVNNEIPASHNCVIYTATDVFTVTVKIMTRSASSHWITVRLVPLLIIKLLHERWFHVHCKKLFFVIYSRPSVTTMLLCLFVCCWLFIFITCVHYYIWNAYIFMFVQYTLLIQTELKFAILGMMEVLIFEPLSIYNLEH
jgi:hypothetical protein